MKKVVATICSSEKRPDNQLIPALDRYLGSHIQFTKAKAIKSDFYILSGLYGLIKADTPILCYDCLLEEKAIDPLVQKVTKQLKEQQITGVTFYTKQKWSTYNKTMKKACNKSKVQLVIKEIKEEK